MLPPALDHVVGDCLAKDPELRWQNAADIARELRWISNSSSIGSTAPPNAIHGRYTERVVWSVAILALLAGLLWLGLRERQPAPTLRSYLPTPPGAGFDFTGDFSGPPVITADGTAVALCARSQKNRDFIWLQSLSDLTPRKLEGTGGASFPFWSADGRFVGFFADGHLKRVPAAGGPVTVLADAPNARGGSWNQDNVIIYEPDYRDSLLRISAAGGAPRPSPSWSWTNTPPTAGPGSCPTASTSCSSPPITPEGRSKEFILDR
jgi:hypothetical protein